MLWSLRNRLQFLSSAGGWVGPALSSPRVDSGAASAESSSASDDRTWRAAPAGVRLLGRGRWGSTSPGAPGRGAGGGARGLARHAGRSPVGSVRQGHNSQLHSGFQNPPFHPRLKAVTCHYLFNTVQSYICSPFGFFVAFYILLYFPLSFRIQFPCSRPLPPPRPRRWQRPICLFSFWLWRATRLIDEFPSSWQKGANIRRLSAEQALCQGRLQTFRPGQVTAGQSLCCSPVTCAAYRHASPLYRGMEERGQSLVYLLQVYPTSRLRVMETVGYSPCWDRLSQIQQDTTAQTR